MTIRLRLTLAYTALVVTTFLALGGATRQLVRGHLVEALRRDLGFRCHALAEEVREVEGRPTLPEEHTAFEGHHSGYLLADPSGRPVTEEGISAGDFPRLEEGQLPREGWTQGWYWRAEAVNRNGRRVAVVLAAQHQVDLESTLKQVQLSLLGLLPWLGAAALAGGWMLSGRALAPMEGLKEQIAAIGEDELDRRVPVSSDEVGQLAGVFNQMLERLQRAFTRQRRFSSDASHELRTPLATIRALTSQRLMKVRSESEYVEALREIDRAAANMTQLVESLLFLARSDTGRERLQLERVDLAELLEVLAEARKESAPGFVLELQGRGEMMGDVLLLTRLLSNLLDNALIHGGSKRVRVCLEQNQQRLQLRLQDFGVGVSPQQLPHLVERFYQADPSRTGQGSGLGLAICQSIVEAHRGEMSLSSPPGQGLQVEVKFPRGL